MEKKYKVKCVVCGKELEVEKSFFHMLGYYNFGHGKCDKCKTHLNFIYVRDKDRMRVRRYDEFKKEMLSKV